MAETHVLEQRRLARARRDTARESGEKFPWSTTTVDLRESLEAAGPTPRSSIIDALIASGAMIKSNADKILDNLILGQRLIPDERGYLYINPAPPFPVPGVKTTPVQKRKS